MQKAFFKHALIRFTEGDSNVIIKDTAFVAVKKVTATLATDRAFDQNSDYRAGLKGIPDRDMQTKGIIFQTRFRILFVKYRIKDKTPGGRKMAIRKIRFIGDPCLNKVCKPVNKITPSIETLIEDMFDTMYEARGVGLAAPQVGILRRICVIDVMDGEPIILINPEIIEKSGEQTDEEGCLSIPGKCASVTRADYVKVKSFDMELNPVIIEGEGLRARALQHEIDHLDGVLYGERANEPYHDVEEEECE